MQDIVVTLHRAPGDTLVLTGLLRDLQVAHPGRYRVWADVNHPELLRHNPWVFAAHPRRRKWPDGFAVVSADYGRGIAQQKHETVHFLTWFHREFARRTGVTVPITRPEPCIYLSPEEYALRPIDSRYWVIVAGGKSDATVKIWSQAAFRRTVGMLRGLGLGVVQCGAAGHIHFDLDGTLNLVGRTSLRDFLRLIYHADGVICGVTLAMHAAAALARPCVVIAGGREAWWWEAYDRRNAGLGGEEVARLLPTPHRYLHTIGLLPCCRRHGCWRNKVIATGRDTSICYRPVHGESGPLPECLDMITPEHVVAAAMSYYEDHSLPPIGAVPPVPRGSDPAPVPVLVSALEGPRIVINRHPPTDPSFDDPIIGGGLTAFVLLYGDFPIMHRRCLDALIATVPRGQVELRVISNRLCAESALYVQRLIDQGLVSSHRSHAENVGKYPAMRAAFHDEADPITTNYLLWLDDDTICDRDPAWLARLLDTIVREHPAGARMFGPPYRIALRPGQAEWIRTAPWYRGRPFRDRRGHESATGDRVHFPTGSFWALHVPTMRELDIPDARLVHNGGDVMIGEQLHQAGVRWAPFASGKDVVNWSSAPRRGRDEAPAGALK
jgi:hypothetical protein